MSDPPNPPGRGAADASEAAAANTTTTTPKAPDGRKRVRKYHPRGFGGCSTCKTRHVKCDEETPKCRNCVRLGLQCDGPQGLSMFKMYDQSNMPKDGNPAPSARKASKTKSPVGAGPAFSVMPLRPEPSAAKANAKAKTTTASPPAPSKEEEEEEPGAKRVKETPGSEPTATTMTTTKKDEAAEDDWMQLQLVPQKQQDEIKYDLSSIQSWDTSYHSHFLNGLASILIIWDAPHNLNPFRKCIPQFAQTSFPLTEAMKALGALHMANSTTGPDKILHLQNAVAKYSSVIQALKSRWSGQSSRRPRLDDLAVCLLMCLYEMMDSRTENWKVHLRGARDIYNQIFSANTGEYERDEEDVMEAERPFRRFLVSLMAYLDVAGAVSTGEGTMLPGSYWESHGGWEYNLGVSSCVMADRASHLALTQIRAAWSTLMAVQADVSAFARLRRQGLSLARQRRMRADLETRLANWVLNAPPAFADVDRLAPGPPGTNPSPDADPDAAAPDPILECAGCVKAYERATLVYCYRSTAEAGEPLGARAAAIDAACDRILVLVQTLARGIGQLGMLWALFVAGTQLADPPRQALVRAKLADMARFGFANVDRAADILDAVWARKRADPAYDWFQSQSFARQPAFLMP